MKRERVRVTLDTGPGLTEQAHKDQCDINFILKDVIQTGMTRHMARHQGTYDDISFQDFQTAMFTVKKAEGLFADLPGKLRKEFKNDPGAFLKFVQNPANKDKLADMGLLKGNDGLNAAGAPSGAPVPDPEPEK